VPKPLRVPSSELAPGRRRVTGPVARYITRVHRLGPGDKVSFFDPEQAVEADARVLEVSREALTCELDAPRVSGYRAHPFVLIQGLAKGDKPDLVLRDATALGVRRIHFVETERAVVHVQDERASSRRERWRRIAVEAARQSGRGDVPELGGPTRLEQALPELVADYSLCLSPHGVPLFTALAGWQREQSISLLVGPEGGLAEAEINLAIQLGFVPASLGPTTLRCELAGIAALGALVAFGASRGDNKESPHG
jgi:16S rRNA (uracil1498-N3)-methyltransferase